MIEFDQTISLRRSLPLVGRARVGVAQAYHFGNSFYFSPPVGATPTPAIFSHGHFGCVLAVRWIGLEIAQASHFLLDTASVSIPGYGHHRATEPAIMLWNARPDATSET